jgi:uncharacterized repeat protein (TIGR03803 family)
MAAPLSARAATFQLIYPFGSYTGDAESPYAGLIADSAGNLYGTTYGGGAHSEGTVYELTPPPTGQTTWTEAVLYSFDATTTHIDGNAPTARLVLGAGGTLFGTCSAGGGNKGKGLVFELVPPRKQGGAWTRKILHIFTGKLGDGALPYGGLAIDANGVLYGTTSAGGSTARHKEAGYGIAFSLAAPAGGKGAWTETILHDFGTPGDQAISPYTDLLLGSNGTLFGTTRASKTTGYGTVYEVVPPTGGGTAWTEKVILNLPGGNRGDYPLSGVTTDASGALYGTAASGTGTIFSLSPPTGTQNSWQETVLSLFPNKKYGTGPEGGVIISGGALFGTLGGGTKHSYGTVFELTPPTGSGSWTQTVLYNFPSDLSEGLYPAGNLVVDQSGDLVGITEDGGPNYSGEAYAITP